MTPFKPTMRYKARPKTHRETLRVITLRIPASLYERVRNAANSVQVSMNQFCLEAVEMEASAVLEAAADVLANEQVFDELQYGPLNFPRNGNWYRVDGNTTCGVCGQPYGEHPKDHYELSYQGDLYLICLCNGDRVYL